MQTDTLEQCALLCSLRVPHALANQERTWILDCLKCLLLIYLPTNGINSIDPGARPAEKETCWRKPATLRRGGYKAQEEGVRVSFSPAAGLSGWAGRMQAEEAEGAVLSHAVLPLGWTAAEVWSFLANSVPGLGPVFSGLCLKGNSQGSYFWCMEEAWRRCRSQETIQLKGWRNYAGGGRGQGARAWWWRSQAAMVLGARLVYPPLGGRVTGGRQQWGPALGTTGEGGTHTGSDERRGYTGTTESDLRTKESYFHPRWASSAAVFALSAQSNIGHFHAWLF